LKSGHLPDFMTQGTRDTTGSPSLSGGDFSRAEREAGRDPVGTVAIGRDNIYILNAAKQWRKTNVRNSKIASLLLGTLKEDSRDIDTIVAQSGKAWAVIYASESKAKDEERLHKNDDTVWLGDVLLPRTSHIKNIPRPVRLKDIGDSWFYAENKKAIVSLIDRTRSGTSGSRKPRTKEKVIGTAPKSTGIKMF
jgi:hypothetical protein